MQKLLVSAAAIALGASVCAQTTFTSPAGYDSTSGDFYGSNFCIAFCGSFYNWARFQVTDAFMPSGKSTLTQLDYRTTTYLTYLSTGLYGMGRKFSALTLQLGHAANTITTTWSTNWSASPTTVFRGAWSVGTISTASPTQVWGNAGSVPFSSSFAYDSGMGNLLQEWDHKGGALSDASAGASYYFIDAYNYASSTYVFPSPNTGSPSTYVPRYYYNSAGGQCNDSAITYVTYDAFAYINLYVYADNYSVTTYQGQGRTSSSTAYTAPGGPILAMLSLGGSDAGVSAGALCNKVHVNTLFPLAIIAKTAGTSTTSASTSWFPTTPFKWNDTWAGNTVYWQAAWNDSKSKTFSLTNATKLLLPKKPVYDATKTPKYIYAYNYGTASTTSTTYTGTSTSFNFVERWTKK